jgi:hypothetical protein
MRRTVIDIPLPANVDADTREMIGEAVIDYITARCQEDKDNKGRGFAAYTDKYADWKGQQKVDLTLSYDMLAGMEIVKNKNRLISIGYARGNSEQPKAEGNHYGTYGKKAPIPGKARPFLGFASREEREILVSIIASYADTSRTKARRELPSRIEP